MFRRQWPVGVCCFCAGRARPRPVSSSVVGRSSMLDMYEFVVVERVPPGDGAPKNGRRRGPAAFPRCVRQAQERSPVPSLGVISLLSSEGGTVVVFCGALQRQEGMSACSGRVCSHMVLRAVYRRGCGFGPARDGRPGACVLRVAMRM
jgi:hypothetical protein